MCTSAGYPHVLVFTHGPKLPHYLKIFRSEIFINYHGKRPVSLFSNSTMEYLRGNSRLA